MNVRIDATSLLLPGAGIKTYLYYWLASLLEAAREDGTVISTYPPAVAAGAAPDHEASARWSPRLLAVHLGNLLGDPLLHLMLTGADVFHASQHMTRMPRRRNVTATVFDLSCWTLPECHTPANVAATRRHGEVIWKACDALIAISSHARDDAIEILGIPGDRIRVIYPGVAESFFTVTLGQINTVIKKYGLNSPYLLFVGCIEPRKNVPGLIQAYRLLPDSIRQSVPLIIAGPLGWESREAREMVTNSGSQIRYLGYVSETDLPGLFGGARVLVYPSYYEGFGLPVAQGMAAGVPVITSNRSSLPEVVGEAGLLVNPHSAEELAAAIQRLLTQPELARDLACRAKARSQLFHWSVNAARSLDLFHELCGR